MEEEDRRALPPGWKKAYSKTRQRSYWHHKATAASIWCHPADGHTHRKTPERLPANTDLGTPPRPAPPVPHAVAAAAVGRPDAADATAGDTAHAAMEIDVDVGSSLDDLHTITQVHCVCAVAGGHHLC